jgi:hypothetical protein
MTSAQWIGYQHRKSCDISYDVFAAFFLRSAHRFFIIAEIRFRTAGLSFRERLDGLVAATLAVPRLLAHLAFAASEMRLRPAALKRRRGFEANSPAALEAPV